MYRTIDLQFTRRMTMKKYFMFVFIVFLLGINFFGYGDSHMGPAKTNVSFTDDAGTTLKGYLALPEGNGPFPGVLLIHEWWGLNNDTTILADALSKEGYAVLAADAFRGSVAQTPEKARKQVTETPQAQIRGDLDAAYTYLSSHSKVLGDKVAVAGFCFGGTQSMYMGTRNPGLAAVIIFYGGGPITDASKLGTMKQAGPVLGIYGEEDQGIPVSEVKAFRDALNSQGVKNNIFIYPGVGHAFVKSDTYKEGTPGKAWDLMVSFLEMNLKTGE
jgi:carboxymethylenebutenolidase